MSAAADTVVVRISATIDNEYANRCPDFLPLDKLSEGRCELTVAEARAVLADAEFNSDRALAEQVRKALATGGH